jgi:hypothetical protein
MNSILSALSEEINHPTISELLSSVEFDFASGAVKVGLSNLKTIREFFIEENVEEHFIEALDALIKAISGKKFDNIKTAKKTIEKIMYMIYPVEDESESDDDESDEEDDDDTDDDEDDDDDDDEEMLDLEDAVDIYNDLLKDKVLNKYIVTKRFKITSDIKEEVEKLEMIEGLYEVVKNIYENFASDKDAEKLLSVLEELDELRE